MGNQQLYTLDQEQLQVILSGMLGDGHITKPLHSHLESHFQTSCIHLEYIKYKKELLKDLGYNFGQTLNTGYKKNIIYTLRTKKCTSITNLRNLSLGEILSKLSPLGFALWFYDDGSLHKNDLFYNLCTHKYSYEEHIECLIPYFKSKGLQPILALDKKSDGREFYYIRFNKYGGAFKIAKLLNNYPLECFKYKVWSSETIQLWSKLQMKLKSEGIEVTNLKFSYMCKDYLKGKSIQDIVQSSQKLRGSSFELI